MKQLSKQHETVHIAAAGYGTRIRQTMTELGYSSEFPKHLLPTGEPGGATLLGRIIRQVVDNPLGLEPLVYVNPKYKSNVEGHPDIHHSARMVCDMVEGNSLHAYIDAILAGAPRALGCAGDFYADYDWADIINHHESNPYPTTFIAAQTRGSIEGLVFDVADNGQIKDFKRPNQAGSEDLINVGIYIFDNHQSVLDAITAASNAEGGFREDNFARHLVEHGNAGAYVLDEPAFNINTASAYEELMLHTSFGTHKTA